MRTGIAPSVWAAEGARAIVTAFELLSERDTGQGDDGPQMSG